MLIAILIAGAAVRLSLAPGEGNGDTATYRSWMESSVKFGLVESYERQTTSGTLPTYPPVSLLFFRSAGLLYQWTYGPDYRVIEPAHGVFAKIPAMGADLATSVMLFVLFARWKQVRKGLLAAAVYALQPAVVHDSAVWGQTDSLYTFFVFATLVMMIWGRRGMGAALFTLAVLTKPQALLFAPLIVFLTPWNLRTMLWMAATSALTSGTVLLPFFLQGKLPLVLQTFNIMHVMHISRTSWNAYNLWWLLLKNTAWDLPSTSGFFLGISAAQIGMMLTGALYCSVLLGLRTKLRGDLSHVENALWVFFAAGFVALAVFLTGTDMHERYLFPFIALALPWGLQKRRNAVAYGVISVLFFLNMTVAFHHEILTQVFRDSITNVPVIIAGVQIVALLWLCEIMTRASDGVTT